MKKWLKQLFCWHYWEVLEVTGRPEALSIGMDYPAWFQNHRVRCPQCGYECLKGLRIADPEWKEGA